MPERHSTKDLFYGHPDWVIAQVCCVHIQTARHWKSGIRKPGATALRLWQLYASDRIVPDVWEGWGFRKDKLYDPQGHETTIEQLRAYPYILALANDMARANANGPGFMERIFGGPPRAAGPRARKPQPFMRNDEFLQATEAERDAVFGPRPSKDLRRRSAQPTPRRKTAS